MVVPFICDFFLCTQIGTNVLKEGVKTTPIATTVMDPMFVFVLMDGKDEIVKSVKHFIATTNILTYINEFHKNMILLISNF